MKRIILTGILFFIFTSSMSLYAQRSWAMFYVGWRDDFAYSIQQTSDGGYIVAGNTSSFGNIEADIWILKISSDGLDDWQHTYGGSSNDSASSIQQTREGGYIVAGHTYSYGTGEKDIWILKLTSTGTVKWQRTYGGNSNDSASSIQQTSDRGYIVAGYTLGATGADVMILKLFSDGNIGLACELVGEIFAIISDTSIYPQDTVIIP